MLGTLYFIQEGADGAIKIGWTTNDPERRRDNLQIGNSHQLRLLAVLPEVEQTVEFEWHARFRAHQKRSEWFYPAVSLTEAIAQQFPPPGREKSEKPVVDPVPFASTDALPTNVIPLVYWLRNQKLRQTHFADRIGISPGHISKVLRGKAELTRSFAIQVELATGGAVKAAELLGVGGAA
jgi:hypothetical protein